MQRKMLVYMPIRRKKGFYVDSSGALAGVFLFPRWVAIVFDALLYNVDRGQEAQVENELNFFCTTVAAKFAATSLVWPLPCIIDALREIRKTFFVKYFTGSSNNVLGNLLFKSFVETFSQNFLTFSFELFLRKNLKLQGSWFDSPDVTL